MALRLGDLAPDFQADTTAGPISFHEWKRGSWTVLFSHPRDFTPVCTTELARAASLKPEFDRRNTRLLGLSVDSVESHEQWLEDIAELTGQRVNFPIVADADRSVALRYDMIHPNVSDTFTVRSVFIIGPDHRIKATATYPASTGRSFDEILRVLDALQLAADYAVATPVDWRSGDEVVIAPTVSEEDARRKFPKGYEARKPWFRVTPPPDR
ncbi:MAG: peroxiredoxin [Gemmatimonadaceae bacterium]|nr:peroxiredoxin [Gemmatimonadaceae bacterium]